MSASVTGTITGGVKGRPWSTPVADLAARDYVIEEFFLEGEATSYKPRDGVELGRDGRWQAEPDGTAPFKTRLVVVRPAAPAAFNGTVMLHWLNVTAGYELGTADDDELLSGYAWVGVSAQKIGIEGFPEGAPAYSGRQAPMPALKQWDPERYAALQHPGDRYSFDIYTNAARSIAQAMPGGFTVERVVATGASQSGARLTTYINAVHPLVNVFDAFVPSITAGWGTPLGERPAPPGDAGAARMIRPSTRLRDDLDTPIFVVNTEFEAIGMYSARRDDDDHFRFWEVAGAPHAVAVAARAEPREGGLIDNPLTYRPVMSAAYRHLHAWLRDGTPPPVMPRIDIAVTGDGDAARPEIQRDSYGNATGGIRLPELAAPIAEYHGSDDTAGGLGRLYGYARPFTRDELRSLYASRDEYVARYRKGVDDLAAAGGLRAEDVPALYDQGEKIAAGLDI